MNEGAALATLAGAGLIVTGLAGIAFPEPLARNFGAPLKDCAGSEFVRATSVRDIALGVVMLSALSSGQQTVTRVVSVCGIGISLSDFLSTRRPVHLAGAALFGVLIAKL